MRSLHRARVASRRLRELVPVLQLDHSAAQKLSKRLRKVTSKLGTVRELDVILLLIDELRESRPQHRDALQRVAGAVTKARDEARKHLFDRLPVDDMWRLSRKLERVLGDIRDQEETRPERRGPRRATTAAWAIDARIARRAGRLTDAIQTAGSVYLPERLHEVRIALKKLRYALELSADAAGEASTPALRTLKRVQEVLGRMHDFQIVIDHVRSVQASLTPPTPTSWRELNALMIELDASCRRLHARYIRERNGVVAIAAKLRASGGEPVPRGHQRAG